VAEIAHNPIVEWTIARAIKGRELQSVLKKHQESLLIYERFTDYAADNGVVI
jgi:hypothetical protein